MAQISGGDWKEVSIPSANGAVWLAGGWARHAHVQAAPGGQGGGDHQPAGGCPAGAVQEESHPTAADAAALRNGPQRRRFTSGNFGSQNHVTVILIFATRFWGTPRVTALRNMPHNRALLQVSWHHCWNVCSGTILVERDFDSAACLAVAYCIGD